MFQHLRQAGIAGKFVEFFGPGVSQLSTPDRTTIANMCPEYNATVSFFPVDHVTLKHFKKTSESSVVRQEFGPQSWSLIYSYLCFHCLLFLCFIAFKCLCSQYENYQFNQ